MADVEIQAISVHADEMHAPTPVPMTLAPAISHVRRHKVDDVLPTRRMISRLANEAAKATNHDKRPAGYRVDPAEHSAPAVPITGWAVSWVSRRVAVACIQYFIMFINVLLLKSGGGLNALRSEGYRYCEKDALIYRTSLRLASAAGVSTSNTTPASSTSWVR